MTHLTIDQLLALREPGSEPGQAEARAHLDACPACSAELDRLHQRVARLRALPTLRPAHDMWAVVDARRRADRRARQLRRASVVTLGLAASLGAVALVRPLVAPSVRNDGGVTEAAIAEAREQSASLEQMLHAYDPDARMVSGRTAGVAQVLEDRIAQVDQRLQTVDLAPAQPARNQERLDLWRQRVGLLDALVDVHVTRASSVGF